MSAKARITGLSTTQADVFRPLCSTKTWRCYWSARCRGFLLVLAVGSSGSTTDDWEPPIDEPWWTHGQWIHLFVPNHAELAESFPVGWQTAIGFNVSLQAFGIATAIFLRAGFWINVMQPSMVQHVQLVTFLELFIGFLCKVGVNLPVRVGNKWMQFDNSNAGTLLGRSLGAQIQVLEWLVRGVFDNHLGWALGVVQIAKPESAIVQPLQAISIPWSNRIVQRRTATMDFCGSPATSLVIYLSIRLWQHVWACRSGEDSLHGAIILHYIALLIDIK